MTTSTSTRRDLPQVIATDKMSLATPLVQKDLRKDPIERFMRPALETARANRYCGTRRRFELPGPVPE